MGFVQNPVRKTIMNLPDCVAMAISVEDNSFIIELAIEDFELLDQEFSLSDRKEFRRAIAMLRQSASCLQCCGEELANQLSRSKT